MDFSIFHDFDYAVFTLFGNIQSSIMNYVARFFTLFGEPEFFIPVFAFIAFCMFSKKLRKTGFSLLFAIIIGTLVTNIIVKPWMARPRPYVGLSADEAYMAWYTFAGAFTESDFSFPSGHTTGAFEIALPLFLTLNKKYSWIFPLVAVFTGFSRIYLMVHYPTDVIGGFIVGTCAGILGWLIGKAIMKKIESSKRPSTVKYRDFDIVEKLKTKA